MLPVEILDHIFSYLDTDPVALRKCLRVHPVFFDLAERRLYAHIAILDRPTVNSHGLSPAQLAKLLLSNVRIADYVRSLHMTVSTSAFDENHWQEVEKRLLRFRMLQRISLTLVGNDTWIGERRVCEAFMNCLRLPSMVEVSILDGEGFPMYAFADCGLKKLTLNGRVAPPFLTLYLPCLESLSIHEGWTSLLHFFSEAKIPKLRSLDFRPYSHYGFGILPQFLLRFSKSLTSLELDFGTKVNISREFDIPTSLSGLPHLERLIIHALGTLGIFEVDHSLRVITTLARSALQLKHLDLRLHFTLQYYFLHDIDWSPFNALFSNSSSSSLQRIDLRVGASFLDTDIPFGDLLSCFEGDLNLGRMVRRGVLAISAGNNSKV